MREKEALEILPEMEEVIRKYPDKRAALLPVLHLVQQEVGYLSGECKEKVAEMLGLTPAAVEGVARFYTMFKNQKMGKYLIQVCTTLPCALLGAEQSVEYLKRKLNIEVGGTTQDEKFSLVAVSCLASCGTAPAMMVNGDLHEELTREKIDAILEGLS